MKWFLYKLVAFIFSWPSVYNEEKDFLICL